MQTTEFDPTSIVVGNDSYDVLRQYKWLPHNEALWDYGDGIYPCLPHFLPCWHLCHWFAIAAQGITHIFIVFHFACYCIYHAKVRIISLHTLKKSTVFLHPVQGPQYKVRMPVFKIEIFIDCDKIK
jgi:hypothetical protein